ncbi:Transposable element Tc1 transposase [Blattella germanica]|nr:Transposable element Tc1 transposase [Blattella germanica]
MVISALHRRTSTARDLQNDLKTVHNTYISDQTVRNRLRDTSLRSRKPLQKLSLNRRHKVARACLPINMRTGSLHWRILLFADKSRFCLTRCDGYVRVWRRHNDHYKPVAMQEVQHFDLGSIVV